MMAGGWIDMLRKWLGGGIVEHDYAVEPCTVFHSAGGDSFSANTGDLFSATACGVGFSGESGDLLSGQGGDRFSAEGCD
jgi:hypothetical protein